MQAGGTIGHGEHSQLKPKNSDAVVVCVDSRLIWQAVFFLLRAIQKDTRRDADYFLYLSEPVSKKYTDLLGADVMVVQHEEEIIPSNKFRSFRHVTPATLLRVRAIEQLSQKYERVIYCDVDMFLRWGSLTDLPEIDWSGRPVAAVREAVYWGRNSEEGVRDAHFLQPDQRERYFNAGMLIANGPEFVSQDIANRAVEFLLEHGKAASMADQTALNVVLSGNWAELPPSWNWQCHMGDGVLASALNPRIMHFSGDKKPWDAPLFLFDEHYPRCMHEFLVDRGLDDEAKALHANVWAEDFNPVVLRRRVRLMRRGIDRYADIEEFLQRNDFAATW